VLLKAQLLSEPGAPDGYRFVLLSITPQICQDDNRLQYHDLSKDEQDEREQQLRQQYEDERDEIIAIHSKEREILEEKLEALEAQMEQLKRQVRS